MLLYFRATNNWPFICGLGSIYIVCTRVRHRGAVPPKMKKPKKLKFSQNGHEKRDLNSEFRHDSVKFPRRIAIYVLCSKIP